MTTATDQTVRHVQLGRRRVRVRLSEAARRALDQREGVLYAQMELYFSCLLRFKLRFSDTPLDTHSAAVTDKLYLSFRPVMTAHCGRDFEGDEPPLTDFPIRNAEAFVPKSVSIDWRRGRWQGSFEYQ